jgi:putative ABC transport system permease protein
VQIAIVAAAGAALRAWSREPLVPALVAWIAGDLLPVAPGGGIFPRAVAARRRLWLLAALAFALVPLARARAVPAATLLRGGVAGALRRRG